MTQDDVIRMAVKCQLLSTNNRDGFYAQALCEFAKLVAAHEREACAKECEHTALRISSEWMAHHCAAAIRARGEQA